MINTFHISRALCVSVIGVLLLFSFSLFLKGFFPIKQGLEGFSQHDEAPNIPGGTENNIPPAKYQRCVLLVIDALREDFVFGTHYQMPYLYQLISSGKGIAFHAKVHPPTVTLPRIKALTTGGIPGFVDVVLNFGSSSLEEDNIMTQFHKNKKDIVFYGDDTWLKLFPDHFLRTDGTTSFFVTDYTEVDTNVSRHLPDELSRYDWDVMILHYLGLDHIGHLAGPRSPLVPPKLLEMDSVIYKIYQAMKLWDMETGEKSVLMVCGDHGMSDQGGHGGATPGETTVPVIFISPAFQSPGVKDNKIMQIDVTPTLSSLFGIPIPKNNLGEIVSEALFGYEIEERVRMLQLNCHQVADLLESNVADINKESGYQLYQQTIRRHSHWLQERNVSSESRQLIGQRIMKDYGKAVRDMRSRVSETSTTYDLYTMGISILLLWTILLFLLYLTRSESDTLHVSPNRLQVTLICCLPFVLGHMTVCTSNFRSEFLCTSNLFLVFLQLAVLFVVVMATLFAIMHFKNQSSSRKSQVSVRSAVEGVFVGGCILHAFSLLSSSFVEEEHQTWYFFLSSIHLLLICHLIGHICPRQRVTDQSKYTLKDDFPNDQSGGSGLYKQRQERKELSGQIDESDCGYDLHKGSVMLSVAAILVVLVLCRVLRRWNQTGDKWIAIPDIGDWLVAPENKRTLSLTMAASIICVCVTRWRSSSITQSLLLVLTMVTTYCFRAANGAVVFPALYHGTSKGLLEARCSYCLIAVYCLLAGRRLWVDQIVDKGQQLWENIQSAWIMMMMLLLRPHNSAYVAMTTLTEYLVSSHIISILRLKPVFLTLYCVWFGQAFFFFQGNSNSLTTVDVSAGYVGLDSYNPVLIGFLMWVSTNGGPVFWMISLTKYLSMGFSAQGTTNRWSEDHVTAAITLLMCRAFPLAVYSVLVTIERYHLFVWTVFSPKLLYEGNSLLVTCLFVFINLLCAKHWRKSWNHHSKSY